MILSLAILAELRLVTDTDRQTQGHSIYCAGIASRGKNDPSSAVMQSTALCQNYTDYGCYCFDVFQPILIIFGRIVAEIVRCQMVVYFPTNRLTSV